MSMIDCFVANIAPTASTLPFDYLKLQYMTALKMMKMKLKIAINKAEVVMNEFSPSDLILLSVIFKTIYASASRQMFVTRIDTITIFIFFRSLQ